jgi:hypothetical protein
METEPLFEISVTLAPPIVIPDAPDGTRIIVGVTGGKFDGSRVSGEVLSSGADWFLVRPDGVGVVDVRIVLKTSDGEHIYMTYNGRAQLGPNGLPQALQTAPLFSASTKGKYAWLNSVQAVATGALSADGQSVTYKLQIVK